MKKITRITIQQKNKNRYNIFLDDTYSFSVDEAILIEFGLRKGLELDDGQITKITQKEKIYKFYTQSIHYLSYRMRTKKEINDYLKKKEVEPEYIEEIIERLTREKLLDDREFAEMFVRTRINTSTKGPKMISQELREKGVSRDVIDQVLELYTDEMQFEKVHKLMEKRLNRSSKHAFRKRLEQTQVNLMQKGFSREIIQEVASNFSDEKSADKEWEAIVYQGEKLMRKYKTKFSGFELRNKLKEGLYRKGFAFDLIERYIQEKIEEE